MSVPPQYIPAAYSLTAVGVWGTSDFLGGVGARRVNAFLFTAIVHISGMVMVGALALMTHALFPGVASVGWSLAAGAFGGHRAGIFLSRAGPWKHGTDRARGGRSERGDSDHRDRICDRDFRDTGTCGIYSRGHRRVADFANRRRAGRPKGLGMAVLAGIGFAGFYLCVHQAGDASALWMAACSRLASFVVTASFVIFTDRFVP